MTIIHANKSEWKNPKHKLNLIQKAKSVWVEFYLEKKSNLNSYLN